MEFDKIAVRTMRERLDKVVFFSITFVLPKRDSPWLSARRLTYHGTPGTGREGKDVRKIECRMCNLAFAF